MNIFFYYHLKMADRIFFQLVELVDIRQLVLNKNMSQTNQLQLFGPLAELEHH